MTTITTLPDGTLAELFEPTALDDPRAVALLDWLNATMRDAQRWPITDAGLAAWLSEAEAGQGQIELPAHATMSGRIETFTL